jgi:hypothetical protein
VVTTSALFGAFHSKIALRRESEERGLLRIVECGDKLRKKYFPQSEKTAEHITILGSLAKDTGVEPLLDADALFRMPAGTYSRFNDYAGNGQSALLQEVRNVLRDRYPRTNIRGDGPVVVVSFSDGPAVEIVPGVLLDDGSNILSARGMVPVTRDGGRWENADYGAEWQTISSLDRSVDGQLRRLIQYMKAWRQRQDASLKSIVLELMAADFITGWDKSRTSMTFDDWLVRDFLKYMVEHYYNTYRMPGTGKEIDTGVGWLVQAQKSAQSAANACRHESDSVLYRLYWQEVFGSAFGG